LAEAAALEALEAAQQQQHAETAKRPHQVTRAIVIQFITNVCSSSF
jgi:hypothetical protein